MSQFKVCINELQMPTPRKKTVLLCQTRLLQHTATTEKMAAGSSLPRCADSELESTVVTLPLLLKSDHTPSTYIPSNNKLHNPKIRQHQFMEVGSVYWESKLSGPARGELLYTRGLILSTLFRDQIEIPKGNMLNLLTDNKPVILLQSV